MQLTRTQRVIDVLIAVLIIALCLFVAYKIDKHFDVFPKDIPTAGVNVSVAGTPSSVVRKKTKSSKPIVAKSVSAYPDSVKNDLLLPKVYADDPEFSLLASTQIKPDRHSSTVSTLLNTRTGESVTEVKREPFPLIGVDHSGEVGLYALQKSGGEVIQLEVKQNLMQIKSVNFGVKASIEEPLSGPSGTDYRVGFGGWVNW